MTDFFRPSTEPARTIYDAFQEEAKKRDGRPVEEWIKAEREAVWKAARDYAQQQGIDWPSIEEVEQAERSAHGHVDYGSKWAYGVARLIKRHLP